MHINLEVAQIVLLLLGPAFGALMVFLHLKIQNAIADLRGELVDKLKVVSDRVIQHDAERQATKEWIAWVSREIAELQKQHNELANSIARCQAFHQGEREGGFGQ